MVRFCREHYPEIHLALAGDLDSSSGAAARVDTLLPEEGIEALDRLIARLGGRATSGGTERPDFSGLPLKGYLSPALIMPVDRVKGSFPALLADQAQMHGVKSFLCKDPRLTPAYVADTEEPKFVPEAQWYAPPAEPEQK